MDHSESKHEKYKSGLQSMEGAPCVVCEDGTLSVSTFTKTRTQGDTTLILKEVPALVCDACGDVTYTEAIGQRLDDLLEAAMAKDHTTLVWTFRGAEVS
jgi:YgiT-type zinc finger domain-containing protein